MEPIEDAPGSGTRARSAVPWGSGPRPRGIVPAGGRGTRLGGAKPTAPLAGRPLISYPLAALAAAGLAATVVAKPRTELPPLDAEVLREPAEPSHPLVGIVTALRHAAAPIVVLGCDFPFVPPALLATLAQAPEPLVVPAPEGEPQPLVARWSPSLLPDLEAALEREEPLRRTVAALAPRLLDEAALTPFGDPAQVFFNVNTEADLRQAERHILRSSTPG